MTIDLGKTVHHHSVLGTVFDDGMIIDIDDEMAMRIPPPESIISVKMKEERGINNWMTTVPLDETGMCKEMMMMTTIVKAWDCQIYSLL